MDASFERTLRRERLLEEAAQTYNDLHGVLDTGTLMAMATVGLTAREVSQRAAELLLETPEDY